MPPILEAPFAGTLLSRTSVMAFFLPDRSCSARRSAESFFFFMEITPYRIIADIRPTRIQRNTSVFRLFMAAPLDILTSLRCNLTIL